MSEKTYILQENGSVTLPAEFRNKYGLQAGDSIAFVETDEGLLISPRETLLTKLLDDIGDSLRAEGITVEQLMADGRKIRTNLLKELYDIDVNEDE